MSDIVTLNGYNIKDEKAVRSYETVAQMKADTKLKEGYHVKTKGYYEVNDGGYGEYVIIDDDTLVEDGGSIHILNNGLRAKLIGINELTPEQFGAYGDGLHDDTVKFQSMLNMKINIKLKENAIYLITGDLNLPEYVSITGNNSTIKINYTGNREHQIRNIDWLGSDNYNNYIYLDNINFYLNSTVKHIKILGLTNYDEIIVKNCKYSVNSDVTYGSCFIDMYSNNRNILFDNNIVDITPSTSSLLNTCFSLRQYSPTGKTENANIINSTFKHDGVDETVWIDGWFGELNNVNFINNNVIDISTSDVTLVWIGLGTEGGSEPKPYSKMKNILIDNCLFEKEEIDYGCIKIGCISTDFAGLNRLGAFVLKNSIINVKTGNGYCINSHDKSVLIENCTFNYDGTVAWNYGYILNGSSIFKNCTFNINSTFSGTSSAFEGSNIDFYNCEFNGNGKSFTKGGTRYLKNCKINGISEFLYITATATNNITIDSCDINCTSSLFKRYNVTNDQLIKISNSELTCDNPVFDNWAVTGNKDIRIINTNFNSNTLTLCNAVDVITINNCTKKGLSLSGIPSTANDRESCVIGSVFDGGAGHTIVRKISAGSETTNWETI